MMLALLLLAAAEPRTAIEAERAFAADAQTMGQWAAFRKWAAADAIMFTPKPTNAQAWLKDRKEPAKAVEWWPTASWVSCDGTVAVNTGGSRWPNGSVGYFTTVWKKQPDGHWRWMLDHGDGLKQARPAPAHPPVRIASCTGSPRNEGVMIEGLIEWGASTDDSLNWLWETGPDDAHRLRVGLWDGDRFEQVVDERVPLIPLQSPKP